MLAGIILLAILAPPLLLPLLLALALTIGLAACCLSSAGRIPPLVPVLVRPLAPRAPPRG